MSLNNYLHSSVGYGAYGDNPLDLITNAGLALIFEPVEIQNPAELRGAKLSRGFRLIKTGSGYKITLNLPGSASALPAEIKRFVGQTLPDPNQPFEIALAGQKIIYVPPQSTTVDLLTNKYLIAGIVGLLVLFVLAKVL